MNIYDYVVVGSGCSGAMAAQTLLEAGLKVTMIDVGVTNPEYDTAVPKGDFITLRRTDEEQYKYFIGEKAEGLSWGGVGKGAQVTPARYHMTSLTSSLIPLISSSFSPLESLGYGGLGIGWGLQCWEWSNFELTRAGLNPRNTDKAYRVVADRIGVSATKDEAAKYTIGNLKNFQPSPTADRIHAHVMKGYERHSKKYIKSGFYAGRTPLALITKDLNERKAYQYQDMDFYTDNELSAWRPWITVNKLKKNPNFTYINNQLVTRFDEKERVINIDTLNIKTNKKNTFACHKLILASGALGTSRIVLRSLTSQNRLPLLSNPHSYASCMQPSMLGKGPENSKISLGQLSYFIDKDGLDDGLSVASSYSYQSLMLLRMINQVPFMGYDDARRILRYLTTSLLVMIIQHPDYPSSKKYLELVKDDSSITGDALKASYTLSEEEKKKFEDREKEYVKYFRKINLYTLKRVQTEHGASVHYGGTVPFSKSSEPYTLHESGRINGTKNIYVADSSGFNFLSAKGLTFTLMANAHIIAQNVINND